MRRLENAGLNRWATTAPSCSTTRCTSRGSIRRRAHRDRRRRFRFGDDFVLRSFAASARRAAAGGVCRPRLDVARRNINPYAGVDVQRKDCARARSARAPKGVEIRRSAASTSARARCREAERRGAAGVMFIPRPASSDAGTRCERRTRRGASSSRRCRRPMPRRADHLAAARAAGDRGAARGRASRRRGAPGRADATDYPAAFQLKNDRLEFRPLATTTIARTTS